MNNLDFGVITDRINGRSLKSPVQNGLLFHHCCAVPSGLMNKAGEIFKATFKLFALEYYQNYTGPEPGRTPD
jgi:hypothetical protein